MTSEAQTAKDMAVFAERLQSLLSDLLEGSDSSEPRLMEAMRYTVLAGGKRLRPYIVDVSASLFEVAAPLRMRVGAAIEMIHCYSLIHDDLPAMDDDDLRRGVPTCHRMFDEATAILAGDALLTMAFEILSQKETHPDPEVRVDLVLALARASGAHGMVAGQMLDINSEHVAVTLEKAENLSRLKTGALISYSAEAGAILGKAGPEARQALKNFGRDIGLAFQINDDLLDVEGNEAAAGKRLGKDVQAGKATFPSLLGADRARSEAQRLTESAIAQLEMFGARAGNLEALARFILTPELDSVLLAASS